MYEIIADPKDYSIEYLTDQLEAHEINFSDLNRRQWAKEIGTFADKLDELKDKSWQLKTLFESDEIIKSTPISLKTLKVQLFKINDALNSAIDLTRKLEGEIVTKGKLEKAV